jgi:hypothetical protein
MAPMKGQPQRAIATTKLPLSFYFWQHIGFFIGLASVFSLVFWYESPPLPNKTHWCILCLGGCLLGLLFHEFRPFNVSEYYDQHRQQQEGGGAAAAQAAGPRESKKAK